MRIIEEKVKRYSGNSVIRSDAHWICGGKK